MPYCTIDFKARELDFLMSCIDAMQPRLASSAAGAVDAAEREFYMAAIRGTGLWKRRLSAMKPGEHGLTELELDQVRSFTGEEGPVTLAVRYAEAFRNGAPEAAELGELMEFREGFREKLRRPSLMDRSQDADVDPDDETED